MTAATPNRAYPYPEGTDFLGDTAAAVEALADAVDTDVEALDGRVTDLEVATVDRAQTTTSPGALPGAVWAAVNTSLDLAIPAAAGDMVEVHVDTLWDNGAGDAFLDFASLVAGAAVNYWSGGTQGIPSARALPASAFRPVHAAAARAVQSGDLTAGVLTLRLYCQGSARTLTVGAGTPLTVWAVNHGPVAP